MRIVSKLKKKAKKAPGGNTAANMVTKPNCVASIRCSLIRSVTSSNWKSFSHWVAAFGKPLLIIFKNSLNFLRKVFNVLMFKKKILKHFLVRENYAVRYFITNILFPFHISIFVWWRIWRASKRQCRCDIQYVNTTTRVCEFNQNTQKHQWYGTMQSRLLIQSRPHCHKLFGPCIISNLSS